MFSDEKYKININFNDGSIIAAKVNDSVFFLLAFYFDFKGLKVKNNYG